jgi:group I intron endonuclease
MIINLVNGKYYIGSAMKNRLYIRFISHLIYYIGSDIVAKAVQKYGLNNFAFIILEYCNSNINKANNDYLLNLETKYLQLLNPPYNILNIAGSSFGYKHSKAIRQKMKINYSQKRKDKIGNLNRGKNLPEETREKLRAIAFKRPKMLENVRIKCGLAGSKPVVAYNLDGTIYKKERSMIRLANYLGINQKTLRLAIRSEKYLKDK